jgi:hypothetical protein
MNPPLRLPAMNNLRIRPMRPDEISIAVNGATAEGWNPGLADDACFAAADPEGFFIGELKGALAATVSCVNYGASFALLHFYTVRKDLRGRRVRTAECGHRARRPTRDRARWRAGAAAKLHEVRFELAYANVRQWVSLIVADLSTGKWAVPGAYSENGDNCQMQLRRRVRTH